MTYNLLCAVHFIHKCNFVHRDIKPSNILITDKLEVKIADFGLSRSLNKIDDRKRTELNRPMSSCCFTRYYRPPEVILAKSDYDKNVDIWSLGCTLYEVQQMMSDNPK